MIQDQGSYKLPPVFIKVNTRGLTTLLIQKLMTAGAPRDKELVTLKLLAKWSEYTFLSP